MVQEEAEWGRPDDPRRGAVVIAPLGLLAGLATTVVVFWALRLVLVNDVGPMSASTGLGLLLAVVGAVAGGLLVGGVLVLVAGRSPVLGAVLLVGLVATGWVLFPARVDVGESFVPKENARWSCTGWEFAYYPPETFDASQDDYCIGLERPIAPG